MDALSVKMLGGFSIAQGERRIDDQSNRMRKVWLLLAYLIYSRAGHMTQEQYHSLLQSSSGEDTADPNGRLKAMFFRARALLDQLGEGTGHALIVRRGGTYAWNTDIPLTLDVEEFDALLHRAAREEDPALRRDLLLEALALYQGDFLPKLAMEAWVMPIHTYYHQRFLEAAHQALILLEEDGQWTSAAALCQRALKLEPYSEELYQHLLRCRIAGEDRAGALEAYEEMSEVLFSTFGVMPSEESRALYRQASQETGNTAIAPGNMADLLKEPAGTKGAMVCDYDFFRLLYRVNARTIVRSGDVFHVALLSLHSPGQKPLARRSLDRAMENLQELLVQNLRQGDVITRCSVSQYLLMLPQANYENSCAVCQRLIKAFFRQYPHSPVQIRFSVHPLEPLHNP